MIACIIIVWILIAILALYLWNDTITEGSKKDRITFFFFCVFWPISIILAGLLIVASIPFGLVRYFKKMFLEE